jgi:predicted transcriptional regulator
MKKSDSKNASVTIKMTDEEARLIDELASKEDRTRSNYLHRLISKQIKAIVQPENNIQKTEKKE